jgi:hypothetical protein
VPRGERWLVRIPKGPPHRVGGLLLGSPPRSVLWKYWSREDPEAPGGNGYRFLAVFEVEKHWRFSTDPVHKLPIKELAEQLQRAEASKDPARAAEDPWFDGQRWGHTMVAAPRGGTMLPDAQVLRIVKRWGSIRRVRNGKPVVIASLAAALLLLALLPVAPVIWQRNGSTEGHSGSDVQPRGLQLRISDNDTSPAASPRRGKDYALLIASNHYKEWRELYNPIDDARAVQKDLEGRYGFETKMIEDASVDQIVLGISQYSGMRYSADDQLFIFIAGHGFFDERTKEGFVVGNNSLHDDLARTTYLPHSRLRDMIDNIPCKHIFVVLDVCFGGTFDSFLQRYRGQPNYREVAREEFIRRKMESKTRQYLTSGGKHYVPDGRPGYHSPFASKLIESFSSGATDHGIVTIGSILKQVEKLDPEPRAGSFGSNEPNSDFLFIAKGK